MADAPAAAPKPCCVCAAPNVKHCTTCKSRFYCGKACQLVDWKRGHSKACKQLAAEFQDRLLDAIMPAKKVKEDPAIVADVLLADGSKAAARLSAVQTTATAVQTDKTAAAKARAPSDVPAWRGTCAICLDLLPILCGELMFYGCCCKKICSICSGKCDEYDTRCPLCRTPPSTSPAEGVRRVQKHVDKGNAEAQFMLGDAYDDGIMGLKKSTKRALQLYERAAAQGHPIAQARLGRIYEQGDGVKINYKTAEQWSRRAAEQGLPEAQSHLGVMFANGKGVAQSYEEAVKWFRLAAAQGYPDALFNLGACYGSGKGVARDNREAMRCHERGAALESPESAAAIADFIALLAAASGRPA